MAAGALAFGLAVKAAEGAVVGMAGLLLGVVAQDGDVRTTAGPAKQDPCPQPVGLSAVAARVWELLPESAGGDAFEAVSQLATATGGRRFTSGCAWLLGPLNSWSSAPKSARRPA